MKFVCQIYICKKNSFFHTGIIAPGLVVRVRLRSFALSSIENRQKKLQCLYENLTSNDFRKTAVLNKISIVN